MKTLLNKKFTIAFAAALLCVTTLKAQIPDKLKYLPYFKMRAMMLESLHNSHAPGKLHNMHCSANAPCLKEQTTLGGSSYDQGSKIIRTRDGGFIVCGVTFSNDGDFHATDIINGDAYIAKYNHFSHLEWAKTYGGSGYDVFNDVVQTYDGGYTVVGQTTSNDGDVSGNHGSNDVWLVKLNASGNIEWQKCYGGTGDEFGNAIVQTIYGGYAITTFTNSDDGDVSGNHNTDGNFDGWFLQIAPKGKLLFQHCYGGSDFDGFFAMVPSALGSFILYGASNSNDGDVSGNHGNGDAWVVKVNALGKIIWHRTVGGSGSEQTGANQITALKDGNIVIDGGSNSTDGDINATNDTSNSFVAKLNATTGAIIWSRSYAEPSLRFGSGIFATRDGGTVETGTVSSGFDVSAADVLVSKFDKNGNEEWYKRFGGSSYDEAFSGYETFDGDLMIQCQTESTDGDVKNNHGIDDEWIIKLGRCGNYIADNATSTDEATVTTKYNTTILLAYPNPVKNSATISFTLLQSQKVAVTICDMNGRLIKTLANTQMEQGSHQLTWNTRDEQGSTVATGIYLLKLQKGTNIETKKLSVVR